MKKTNKQKNEQKDLLKDQNFQHEIEKPENQSTNISESENISQQNTDSQQQPTHESEQTQTNENEQQIIESSWEEKYNELLKKFEELSDKYLRLNAEFDNYRKRTLKEKMELVKTGGSEILTALLPTIDDLERAISYINQSDDLNSLKEGVNIIYNSFKEFLKQRGVKEIDAKDKPFDTTYHEAVSIIPASSEEQKGLVVDVIQKGYILNDEKILRVAKVVVAQ